MKQYKIVKILFAKNFADAVRKEKTAEVVDVMLNEDITLPGIKKMGF